MAHKLSFKYQRQNYHGTIQELNTQVTNEIKLKLNQHNIHTIRVYDPSRDSIKVLIPTEKDVNQVLLKIADFKEAGFEPRISMKLKAARTVYCHGFDPVLLGTYQPEQIAETLKNLPEKWKVKGVYIMQSKKSLKIEFNTSDQARKFIESTNTSIGGIQLHKEQKEIEVDPTIPQCWECGQLQPSHKSDNCPGPKRCLKCGDGEHDFFVCDLPKDVTRMTREQKDRRYCIPCRKEGNHTSLDHRKCDEKRKLVMEKIKTARVNRKQEESTNKRDIELIKQTLKISNTDIWPALTRNPQQHQKSSMILLLTLLEESLNPGIFQEKLDRSLRENDLPNIKYTLEPGTAETVKQLFTCNNNIAEDIEPQPGSAQPRQQNTTAAVGVKQKTKKTPHFITDTSNPALHPPLGATAVASTSRAPTAHITKFSKDTSKHEKRQAAKIKRTPIPSTGLQNIPPQFVLQNIPPQFVLQDLQQTSSILRSHDEDSEYHITNNSEVLAENTLNDSFASTKNPMTLSEPNLSLHKTNDIYAESDDESKDIPTSPTSNLIDDIWEYNVPKHLNILRLRIWLKQQGIDMPNIIDVKCQTPQKIFTHLTTAKQYFQLMLEQNVILESPEWSPYCIQQLSDIALLEEQQHHTY